jgi:hypothetical protein
VILYDLGLKGYHTPLTREQIAELFCAGCVDRHHPCKPTAKSDWRTIDELFPLLKYDSASYLTPSIDDSRRLPVWPLLAGASLILIVAAVAFFYFSSWQEQAHVIRAIESSPLPQPYSTSTTTNTPVVALQQPNAEADQTTNEMLRERARLEQQRFEREQLQRQQAALADRRRVENDEASAKARRAEGTDVLCPLDQTIPVNVGGSSVTVKIHDNDVTTFDAWINGLRMHEVQKQKGISHSRTDETLLYQSGGASLYYVWEISGELNHCLLRVREE